jgi:uncharacterized protein (TIGR02147 family)
MRTADYRDRLKDEFLIRSRARPSYSMRAFARDLGVAPSRLCELFQKRTHLSARNAKRISEKLSLNLREQEYFCKLVEASASRSPNLRKEARKVIKRVQNEKRPRHITEGEFSPISEWYHLVLIELAAQGRLTTDFSMWAKALNLNEMQVRLGVEKLIENDFLKPDGKHLRSTDVGLFAGDQGASASVRHFHEQILNLAREKLSLLSLRERDFNLRYVSLSEKQYLLLMKKIREFLDQVLEEGGKEPALHNDVYALALQLFKVTKTTEG